MSYAFGFYFRSKGERDYAVLLQQSQEMGEITRWKYEQHYHLTVNNREVCEIIPDFTVWYPDSRIEVHEIKGGQFAKTRAWSLKKKLFQALYPWITYRTIDTYEHRRRKKAYRTWMKDRGWQTIQM